MWSFLTGGLSTIITSIASGIVGPVFSYLGKKQDTTFHGFKTATGYDLEAYKAKVDADAKMAAIRAGSSTTNSHMITWAVGLIALTSAMHWAGVEIDSTWTFGSGHYGNLGIPKLPAPYDGCEWEIIKSLFYIGPAMPVAAAAAQWLNRK